MAAPEAVHLDSDSLSPVVCRRTSRVVWTTWFGMSEDARLEWMVEHASCCAPFLRLVLLGERRYHRNGKGEA
jgi:hypothetical protein